MGGAERKPDIAACPQIIVRIAQSLRVKAPDDKLGTSFTQV